jgi:hypothetical protein
MCGTHIAKGGWWWQERAREPSTGQSVNIQTLSKHSALGCSLKSILRLNLLLGEISL